LSKAPKICVIDDDDLVCMAMQSFIRSLGYRVNTFASAEEYLSSDSGQEASCLMIDVQMPGMTGIELQSRLIADGCRVPIIFMSAFAAETVRARAMEAGTVGFLNKPFDVELLVKYLEDALKRYG